MTRIFITIFCLSVNRICAAEPSFPEFPESPILLIKKLETSGDRYIVSGPKLEYVKESDIPDLVALLDSEKPCAFVDLSESSIRFPGKSTIGHEAAYLIEGFWKRYYPTDLTSQRFKPNIQEIKHWYTMWIHFKKLAEQGALMSAPISGNTIEVTSDTIGKSWSELLKQKTAEQDAAANP